MPTLNHPDTPIPHSPYSPVYRTGDLAKWLPDGNIEFLGRIDYQVKVRGFRIELEEIQNQLLTHHEVKDAVVIAREDNNNDRYLCAYIVAKSQETNAIDQSELREYLANRLPDYMTPSYFVHLDKIPLTPNGKIDRKSLPGPEIESAQNYVAPRDMLEEKLAGTWSEVLAIEKDKISIDDNFFQLGGHSLKATRLMSKIHKTFDVSVPLKEIFQIPTIRGLAIFIKESAQNRHVSIECAEKKEYYDLSSAQNRLYLLHHMDIEYIGYNMPSISILEGELDKELLESTVKRMIAWYESLRTSFEPIDEVPVQRIHDQVEFDLEYYRVSGPRSAAGTIDNFIRPFDLSKAPLVRVGLIIESSGKQVLMFDMHHIVSDGTSLNIVVKDFMTLYRGEDLPGNRIQYKDYSEWWNREQQGKSIKQQEDFWVSEFEGEIPVLGLPVDFPRPAVQGFEGSHFSFEITKETVGALKELTLETGVTLFMMFLAVYNIFLAKLANQEDIVVGSPVAGRGNADLENIIGIFINTLALRNYPSGEKTFLQFLQEVKNKTLNAFENQDYQYEKLIEKVAVNRDAGRNPLFDTMFGIQNMDAPNIEIPGLKLSPNEHKLETSRFDLSLGVFEGAEKLSLNFEYSTNLFKKNTIERFAAYIKEIVSTVIDKPGINIRHVEILLEEEKGEILHNFNRTTTDYPKDKTIHELFAQQAEKTPDRIAVVGPLRQISYGELNNKSNGIAYFLGRKGVKPDTIVGMMFEPSVSMIIGILGILKAGGAYLPIEPDLPPDRLKTMLDDCDVYILLSESSIVEKHSFSGLQNLRSVKIEPVVTSKRPQILDFDGFPLPDRSVVDNEKYNRYLGQAMVKNCISIQATRGCPYNCVYCHKIWPKRHVVRSAENIFEEVKLYYDMGVRRFAFIDDIFNLDKKNSVRFFKLIIQNGLDVQIFFPNGVRADILTKDYIDLMVKAGTTSISFALETASPRLQVLIQKHMNLERFRENIEYIIETYPQVILELFTMHGFPSETREEAMLTLDFIKSLKWVHFPYVFIVKIYPNTDMAKLALDQGVSIDSIYRSQDFLFHELPETLPFERNFTLNYQTDFFNNYFLEKERLLHVLPYQMKVMTENEIVKKYNSYLPENITNFDELLEFIDIKKQELGTGFHVTEQGSLVPDLNKKIIKRFPLGNTSENALRILLMDLSQHFSRKGDQLRDLNEPPLGLMYLRTYLNQQLGSQVNVKIIKSQIDFDNYAELKTLLEEFKPDIIGIRTLTFFKNFFHKTIALIRQWGIDVPVITGGPYASSDYTRILQDRNIDVVVIGEGEITFCELVEKIIDNDGKLPEERLLDNIPGIAYVPKTSNLDKPVPHLAREILLYDELHDCLALQPGENGHHYGHSSGDLAYIIFTSGSTGRPKGVCTNHYNVTRVVRNTNYIDLTEKDRLLQLSNYAFDGSVFDIYGALLNGAVLVVIEKENILSVEKLLPDDPFNFFFLDDDFDRQYRAEEKAQNIFSSFTIIAIVIACLGLFGLAAFTTQQRFKEIGIRKVLGASVPGILFLLAKEFFKWVLLSNIIAWPIAYIAANKWLQNFAYRTDIGIWTFLFSALAALAIALLAVSYQSVKAAIVNPVEVLKYE